jgi:LPXTG-site transpeptidase (sortase) family protein|nr:MAG TPA: Sortase [Caudoviricetes sp.]
MKKFINILIFLFIFALYLITFMMIYDNFRERKLNNQEKYALELFENKIEKKKEEIPENQTYTVSYKGYTILGRIEIPRVGINTVILKEHTYAAMNIGAIKTYGVDLNEKGGFVISAHNFRGKSSFFYPIRNLKNGDKINISDNKGRNMEYTVYSVSRYVKPNDTSYLVKTDDYHVTLVTCENGGKSRIVVKAHIVE